MKQVHYLSGLPRSGSTVLANLLGMHPEITSTPSSPLCNIVQTMRKTWSEDVFFKAQLEKNFDAVSDRIKRTTKATMLSWSNEGKGNITVDKNRGWLSCIEWLREVFPDFKMIVTLRDLRNVYASIEKRHRNTLLIDFPDHMEHNIVDTRANVIFDNNGLVGSCLRAIYNIGDIPDIAKHLLIWRYEDFLKNPQETMNIVFKFLDVEPIEIDFTNIEQNTFENDAFYNMKYLHSIKTKLEQPTSFVEAKVSPRILQTIITKFDWYYKSYYPEFFVNESSTPIDIKTDLMDEDITLIKDLEDAIKRETNN